MNPAPAERHSILKMTLTVIEKNALRNYYVTFVRTQLYKHIRTTALCAQLFYVFAPNRELWGNLQLCDKNRHLKNIIKTVQR